jgi:hypothetical protein
VELAIDAFVGVLDLRALGFGGILSEATGRPSLGSGHLTGRLEGRSPPNKFIEHGLHVRFKMNKVG